MNLYENSMRIPLIKHGLCSVRIGPMYIGICKNIFLIPIFSGTIDCMFDRDVKNDG